MQHHRSSAEWNDLAANCAPAEPPPPRDAPQSARLLEIKGDGSLLVQTSDGHCLECDWLISASTAGVSLAVGDDLLVLPLSPLQRAVVLGRIGRYSSPPVASTPLHVTIEAGETLSLKCGEAAVDLRADGKVMIRGEDVLLRAKGAQRIRAGTVAIN